MNDEIKSFLREYGWSFEEQIVHSGRSVVLTHYFLGDGRGILIALRVEGDFVVVSTMKLFYDVPREFAVNVLSMNDKVKLVKLFSISSALSEKIEIEMGFELWAEAWNKSTFFAFMDMFCMGIDTVLGKFKSEKIPHKTKFVNYK